MNDLDISDLGQEYPLESLRQQTVLAAFGELALKSDNLDEILTEACRLVGKALGTDLAKVMELQQDGTTLLVRAGVGWKPGVVGVVTLDVVQGTSQGYALKTGEPMISPNIATETRFIYPAFLIENGVKAVANVVLHGGQDKPPFGILQIGSRKPRHFTGRDIEFLRGYANLLASAVERVQAIKNLRDEHTRLRASLNRQEAARETGLIGFYEWHVPTNTIIGDRRFASFYNLDPETTAAGVPLSLILGLYHPDDRGAADVNVAAAHALPMDFTREFRLPLADGGTRWLLTRGHCHEQEAGRPIYYTGTTVDITASKAAEEVLRRSNELLEERVAERTHDLVAANVKLQTAAEKREQVEQTLRHAHKMEAIGQLTGGLAHDFNNMLAAISGSLELIALRASQGRTADLGRYIEVAQTSATRAATLTARLLAFARRQTLDPKPTHINQLVGGLEDLFRRTVGPTITVETDLADDLWPTLCDANQMENVLLNLVINARDAMPDGGSLVIETANAVLPDRRGVDKDILLIDVPPGDYVALHITDTGTGMGPDVLARAFDPFFTTKPIGQGTGLGLSMIHGFVHQSGGRVLLRSVEGQGTTVTIYLPRHLGAGKRNEELDTTVSSPKVATSPVLLVVEDEPAVRMVVVEALANAGYTVLEADDARSALHIVECKTRIDLLVTDIGLPNGMNGRQLADAARQLRPGLKVLFVTGYAAGAPVGNFTDQDMQLLSKPFRMDALKARVQGMLDGN